MEKSVLFSLFKLWLLVSFIRTRTYFPAYVPKLHLEGGGLVTCKRGRAAAGRARSPRKASGGRPRALPLTAPPTTTTLNLIALFQNVFFLRN